MRPVPDTVTLPRPTVAEVAADLGTEQASLDRLLDPLDNAGWRAPTPAAGWDVRDTVAHLAGSEEWAAQAVTDPAGFTAMLAVAAEDPTALIEGPTERGRSLAGPAVQAWWREGRERVVAGVRALPDGARVGWFGPPMGPASFLTARLMEAWAHGEDVADAVGVRREPTVRLRHVAHLGVATRGFSYLVRGRPAPADPVRVELVAPGGGEVWAWGPADAPDRVAGSALDWCLLVTHRRHRDDLALSVAGAAAQEWVEVAQCFAGPPGPGRPPRSWEKGGCDD